MWIAAFGLVSTAVAGFFGYRKAAKAADIQDRTDDRRANLTEIQAVNRTLSAELDRVRSDAAEDRQRHRQEMDQVRAELRWLRGDRADQIRRDQLRAEFDRRLMAWIHEWLPRARALGLVVPDPPSPPALPDLIDPELLGGH